MESSPNSVINDLESVNLSACCSVYKHLGLGWVIAEVSSSLYALPTSGTLYYSRCHLWGVSSGL